MDKPLILLVEDHPDIMRVNRDALLSAGYRTAEAGTLREAREQLAALSPALIVLDILLPDGSGLELCVELRRLTTAPILFLTSLGDSAQIVDGLRAGGDDYLVKPYDVAVFVARVAAQLRRQDMMGEIVIGRLRVDRTALRAYYDDKDLLLKPKEYALLAALMRERYRHLTAESLFSEAWGMDAMDDVRTVQVHLSRLRRKLDAAQIEYRLTFEAGRGYQLTLAE